MIDKFDYEEPACLLKMKGACAPQERIPVRRIMERVDGLFAKNDYIEAGRLLVSWKNEAVALGDLSGELTMQSELVGYFRKQNDEKNGIESVLRALELIKMLGQEELASGATVLINCATAYKAFGRAEEAMPLYRRAEEVYKRTLSPNDERFGGLYNNMGLALVDLGDKAGAEAAYAEAVAVMESIDGGEPDCAITYVNLAHMYEKFGETEMIDPCMKRARALLLGEGLTHDGYYAYVAEKCAPSFGYFGDTATYELLKRESERIYAGA